MEKKVMLGGYFVDGKMIDAKLTHSRVTCLYCGKDAVKVSFPNGDTRNIACGNPKCK